MGNQVMGTWQNIGYKLGFQDADKALLQRSLTYTFLLGLCAHGFGILNLNICHDSLFDFYDSTLAHQHQIGLGRVLEPLYREMTASGLLMPWSIGLLAFCWLGLAVFLVCKLFHISGRMEIFLIAGIMTVNISVTAIFASYTPWLAADMLALLLASGGGYFWYVYTVRHTPKMLVLGALAVFVSMAIYQCYIAVTVVLIILLSLQNLVEHGNASKVFRDGLAGIGMITAGGVIYYPFTKVVCKLTQTTLAEGYYDSMTNLWDNKEPVRMRLLYCLKEGMTHFMSKDENIYPYPIIWAANGILFCVCCYLAVRLVKQCHAMRAVGWLLMSGLVAALPFAANMMRLLNPSVHDLMVYAIWLLYLMPLLLWKWTAQGKSSGKIYSLILVVLSFLVFADVQTNNAVYVKKETESKATLALMTEIMAQVHQVEGYVPGKTGVTFIGQVSNVLREVPGTEPLKGISGCNKSCAITYEGTYQAYFDNVMLQDVKVIWDGSIQEKQEIALMPSYPRKGYVKMVDDIVVIKLE
ncbi:MAG: hypothetical protein HFI62_00515 [Lachnospiraceae bacterium]|nr:hypothetical protein [Lachnospiraceae bacterium]